MKVLDLLNENGVKSLDSLKDELWLSKLHYLSHSRLVREIQLMKTRYPDLELKSNGVNTPVDKQKRTPFDYIPPVVDAFKRIKKGSNYYQRIFVKKKPKGKLAYQNKMEKSFDITLKQGYVSKVA